MLPFPGSQDAIVDLVFFWILSQWPWPQEKKILSQCFRNCLEDHPDFSVFVLRIIPMNEKPWNGHLEGVPQPNLGNLYQPCHHWPLTLQGIFSPPKSYPLDSTDLSLNPPWKLHQRAGGLLEKTIISIPYLLEEHFPIRYRLSENTFFSHLGRTKFSAGNKIETTGFSWQVNSIWEDVVKELLGHQPLGSL